MTYDVFFSSSTTIWFGKKSENETEIDLVNSQDLNTQKPKVTTISIELIVLVLSSKTMCLSLCFKFSNVVFTH